MAAAYLSRPPYPRETFTVLSQLIAGRPRRVLDVGCGTGSIARFLAPLVDAVEAVDFSAPMIETARSLPGGKSRKISWSVCPIEDYQMRPSYSLIVGGQSLHWVNWNRVFPRFREALAPGRYLAVVDLDAEPTAWKRKEDELVKEFSTNPDYRPYDMVTDWEKAGVFKKVGKRKTAAVPFVHSVEGYLEWLHSRSSLTRTSMGPVRAAEFDKRVAGALEGHIKGSAVQSLVFSTVVWGTLP